MSSAQMANERLKFQKIGRGLSPKLLHDGSNFDDWADELSLCVRELFSIKDYFNLDTRDSDEDRSILIQMILKNSIASNMLPLIKKMTPRDSFRSLKEYSKRPTWSSIATDWSALSEPLAWVDSPVEAFGIVRGKLTGIEKRLGGFTVDNLSALFLHQSHQSAFDRISAILDYRMSLNPSLRISALDVLEVLTRDHPNPSQSFTTPSVPSSPSPMKRSKPCTRSSKALNTDCFTSPNTLVTTGRITKKATSQSSDDQPWKWGKWNENYHRRKNQPQDPPQDSGCESSSNATSSGLSSAPNKSVSRSVILCDGCDKTVVGFRAKCRHPTCPDFDLCAQCYDRKRDIHPEHPFSILVQVNQHNPTLPNQRTSWPLSPSGITCDYSRRASKNPVATVTNSSYLKPSPKCDESQTGLASSVHNRSSHESLVDCSSSQPAMESSDAIPAKKLPNAPLLTDSKSTVTSPRVVIKCDGCSETIIGFRAKCTQVECPDFDLCLECFGDPNRLHPNEHTFAMFKVAVDDGGAVTSCRSLGSLAASAPKSSSHDSLHDADCDMCSQPIRGTRWKCLDCPDWDCCEGCFGNVQAIHPFHRLVPITDPSLLSPELPARHLKRHPYVHCDACGQSIRGIRYKCSHPDCLDYDLCSRCESSPIPKHDINHAMLKIHDSQTWQASIFASNSSTTRRPPSINGSTCSTEELFGLAEAEPSVLPRANSSPGAMNYQAIIANRPSTPSDCGVVHSTVSFSANGSDKMKALNPATPQEPHIDQPIHSPVFGGSILVDSGQYCQCPTLATGDPNFKPLLTSNPMLDIQSTAASDCIPSSSYAEKGARANPHTINQNSISNLPGAFPKETSVPACLKSSHQTSRSEANHPLACSSIIPESSQGPVIIPAPCGFNADQPGLPFGASFVSDLNLPDGTCVSAGARFTKVWLVRNTGYEQWPLGTQIVFSGGFEDWFREAFPVPAALPNEVVEISIESMAPEESGGYMQVWRLVGPDGKKFGDRLWLNLRAVKQDQVDPDDPGTSALSASVGFLLPDMTNRRSADVESLAPPSSFSQPSLDRSNTTPTAVDSHPTDDDLSNSVDLIDPPFSLSGSEPDNLSYEFTSGHDSERDSDESEFDLVTDSDSSDA